MATNDISDIRPGAGSPFQLPIRGEKRIIPHAINPNALNAAQTAFDPSVSPLDKGLDSSDFFITAAKKNFTDYVKIRIPNRGVNPNTMQPDRAQDAEYHFLINPATVNVNRQTVDSQSFTRGGWQFGVWGEDISHVQLSGQSAGSYFMRGLTDEFAYYALSYRNLMQLQQVFENNGYWFEGEEANEGPLAADYLRRRIRVHQDVELWVGNFIWYGMFDSLTISQDAQQPFKLDFQIGFVAWKERFRDDSPYSNSILNNVQRGHSYSAVDAVMNSYSAASNNLGAGASSSSSSSQEDLAIAAFQSQNVNSKSPAVVCAAAEPNLYVGDSQVRDTQGDMPSLLNPENSLFNT